MGPALLIALLAALLGLIPVAPAAAEIVLGAPTGALTLEGGESINAARLAVEEINAAGGVLVGGVRHRLTLKSCDLGNAAGGGPVDLAVARLADFMEREKPHAMVVGPFRSEVLLASMDLIAGRRVPLLAAIAMSPAVDALVLRNPKYRYIFRVCLSSKYLVDYLAGGLEQVRTRFGFSRVFVINQDVAWARTTASLMIKLYFDRAGWEVLGQSNHPSGSAAFADQLLLSRDLGAQVLLSFFDMPTSSVLIEQWRRMEHPALLMGFISPMVGESAWAKYHGNIVGSLNVVFELGNLGSERWPPAERFARAYARRWGRPIESGHGPAPAYESVHMLAEAFHRAGSLAPQDVVEALEATDRVGAMGRLRFHDGHQVIFGADPREEALACVVQWTAGGRRRIVYPPSVAEGPIELPPFVNRGTVP